MRSANAIERLLRRGYVKWIRPRIGEQLNRQRFKLLYDVWGYAPMLSLPSLSVTERIALVSRFLQIDWNILHAHKPAEIATICKHLASRPANPGEGMVEAGCWNGGSAAKFSLICARLGYHLYIFDSFEGVEKDNRADGEIDFGGSYAAPEEKVAANIERYGDITVCTLTKGWFAESFASPVTFPVRTAYIDCDIASATREVLAGVVPALVEDGHVFSQDFHLPSVRRVLVDPETWRQLGKGQPAIEGRAHLATIQFR